MGQAYNFNRENDDLLLEAELAFDLSARRTAMMKSAPFFEEASRHSARPLAGLLSLFGSRKGETHVGS